MEGLESELAVAVDVMFPITTRPRAMQAFHRTFPRHRCAFGYLTAISSAIAAAPDHPLAKIKGTVSRAELSKHEQLVLSDHSSPTAGREFGVMPPQVWRLADLGARHAFLDAGIGWGRMPLHMVEQDIWWNRISLQERC